MSEPFQNIHFLFSESSLQSEDLGNKKPNNLIIPQNSVLHHKKVNKSPFQNEKQKKNNINSINRQIQSNLLKINPLKHKSFIVNQNYTHNISHKPNIYKMKNHNNISKTKISNVTIKMNHRPSETNDLSLSIGMGSLMNIDKTAEGMDNESSSKDKKVLIKVNTKRHQLAGNLSNINTSKTKRVINLKENGLFQNLNEINKMNHKSPKNKKNEYDNDMKKITLIQNWWKNIYYKNKKKFNSFSYLVVCIKKVFCLKIFELIQNKFPSIDYFFHKWNDKVTKLKIINRLLKKLKKTRNKKDKIDINNKLDKKSTNKSNQEKSKDKSQK